jgi:hypothetical protein
MTARKIAWTIVIVSIIATFTFVFLTGCSTEHMAHKDRFDITFLDRCPKGFVTQFKNGYCRNADCPVECVRVKPKPTPKPIPKEVPEVTWRVDDIAGDAEAGYNNKPLMVFIKGDDKFSKKMETTFQNPKVIKAINNLFVPVKYNYQHEDVKKYKPKGIPVVLFFKIDQESKTTVNLGQRQGYTNANDFYKVLAVVYKRFNDYKPAKPVIPEPKKPVIEEDIYPPMPIESKENIDGNPKKYRYYGKDYIYKKSIKWNQGDEKKCNPCKNKIQEITSAFYYYDGQKIVSIRYKGKTIAIGKNLPISNVSNYWKVWRDTDMDGVFDDYREYKKGEKMCFCYNEDESLNNIEMKMKISKFF